MNALKLRSKKSPSSKAPRKATKPKAATRKATGHPTGTATPISLSSRVGGLQPFGKRQKEFCDSKRPARAERAGARESLGRGEEAPKSRLSRHQKVPISLSPVGSRTSALRPGIEQDTELMPWLIADTVLEEATAYLDTDLPAAWSDWLDQRAEGCYRKHKQFRSLVRGRGNRGRDTLYRFFRHWLASRLHREKRRLYRCLPHSYSLGLPLYSR